MLRVAALFPRLAGVACAVLLVLPVAADAGQARLAVHVFARVPAPGYPANVVVGRTGTVYTGTFKSFSSPSDTGPSKVFAFSPSGKLLRTYTVRGQTSGTADAVQVATVDRQGTLYLLDQSPARVLKLDPRTGRQSTWATFASLPSCGPLAGGAPCSDGSGGNPPEPDFATWGPDGSLYVTDYNQALIWRIPPGGGPARVWLTDPRLNGTIVGPAGLQLMPGGHSLLLGTGGGGTDPSTGKLYEVAITRNGKPGPLVQLWESGAAEAPDGLAIARSGDIYVALVGPNGNAVVEVSPLGREIARVPTTPLANSALSVPFDAPGSVTFDGDRLLVANEASIDNDSSRWAILEIDAGEPGLPVSLPPAAAPRSVYRLRVRPGRVRVGRRISFTFTAVRIANGRSKPLAGALVRFARHSARTGRRGHARIVAVLRGRHHVYRARLYIGRRQVAVVLVRTR